ncbi:hypothetical protein ABZ638_14895 [Streptomyces sp. NPDC007107]|uniref:hypothetical protein n=1 Tax=Streptomyces sp. NPDC007107 TaxID=3156915 RepID=UPI0034063809
MLDGGALGGADPADGPGATSPAHAAAMGSGQPNLLPVWSRRQKGGISGYAPETGVQDACSLGTVRIIEVLLALGYPVTSAVRAAVMNEHGPPPRRSSLSG